VFLFICLVGLYRVLYAANWIYKKIKLGSAYSDSVSWIGGVIEILLFLDFLLNQGFLRALVLTVDTKVNELSDQVELRVFRRRSHDQGLGGIDNELRKRGQPRYTDYDDVDEAMLVI
jgi:hypothetical protein